MDVDNQAQIKKIAEGDSDAINNLIVVLGASDLEGALISAETVTTGDPGFAGPLAGVSLRLPVYHILEPEIKKAIPADAYEEEVGIWALTVDIDKIGEEFRTIRDNGGGSD